MTKKYDREFGITDENNFYAENTHLDINSEKVILDGKPISEWLELITNIQSRNAVLAGKVAQLEAKNLGDESVDTADSKHIMIGNKKYLNITVTNEDGNVVAVITPNEIVERKGCKVIYDVGEQAQQKTLYEENKIKTENKFAIMEQTPERITITLKDPNTIKKSKVMAQNITALDNAGLFIKPSGSISDAKLMVDGKPLAEIIDDLRAAIKSIGVQVVALQASEAAAHASGAAQRTADNKGEGHDEHK